MKCYLKNFNDLKGAHLECKKTNGNGQVTFNNSYLWFSFQIDLEAMCFAIFWNLWGP